MTRRLPATTMPHDLFDRGSLSAHRPARHRCRQLLDGDRSLCDGAVRSNTGVTLTQGFPNPRNNYLAINLLGQGHTAGQALATLIVNDARGDYRQIAIVDRDDNAVIHSGGKLRPWAAHRIGKGYVAFGDGLAGPQVVEAMAARFEGTATADLDERLLAALEAGRDAGGLAGVQGTASGAIGCVGGVGQSPAQRDRSAH